MNPEISKPVGNSDVAALVADGRPFVRCSCGFVAMSSNATDNESALAEHPCPNVVAEEGGDEVSWLHFVFSFWGLVIIGVIVYGVLMGIGAYR